MPFQSKGPNEHWLEGDSMVIKLTQGKVARIEGQDWPSTSRYRWYAIRVTGGRFYAATEVDGRRLYLHHLIAGKPPQGFDVNHISGDSLDNRRSNLETTSHHKNTMHMSVAGNRANTSGHRGVTRVRNARGECRAWKFQCGWGKNVRGTERHQWCVQKSFPYTDQGFEQACQFARNHWLTKHPDCAGYESSDVREPAQVRAS